MIQILDYTRNPLTTIGKYAGICTGADITDPVKNKNRGIECIDAGHRKVMEYANITFLASDYSAKVMRELYTHCVGISKLQDSTRRKDMSNFSYYMPFDIKKDELAAEAYNKMMETIRALYKALLDARIKKEDASYVLPMAYNTNTLMCFDVTALSHVSEERMCTRALFEFRTFMNDLDEAIKLQCDDEWIELASMCMKCKCIKLGYCPEVKSCGFKPTKEQVSFDIKPEYLEKK